MVPCRPVRKNKFEFSDGTCDWTMRCCCHLPLSREKQKRKARENKRRTADNPGLAPCCNRCKFHSVVEKAKCKGKKSRKHTRIPIVQPIPTLSSFYSSAISLVPGFIIFSFVWPVLFVTRRCHHCPQRPTRHVTHSHGRRVVCPQLFIAYSPTPRLSVTIDF